MERVANIMIPDGHDVPEDQEQDVINRKDNVQWPQPPMPCSDLKNVSVLRIVQSL